MTHRRLGNGRSERNGGNGENLTLSSFSENSLDIHSHSGAGQKKTKEIFDLDMLATREDKGNQRKGEQINRITKSNHLR